VLLAALSRRRGRRRLRALHIDHGLAAGAAAWVVHCRAFTERIGVPLEVLTVQVERTAGASLEAAAREARYRALAGALGAGEVLLTAQHADDQLETVLLQLLRGAGLPGIAAMPAVAPFARGRLARPLLGFERTQIEAWARAQGLEWVEDSTNADERRDRNYLRRQVTPLLRARWPAVSRAVARSARHAAEAQRLLELMASADVAHAAVGGALSVQRLRPLSPERRRNALRFWIGANGHPLPDARRLGELAGAALDARADANPEVSWERTRVRREHGLLSLELRAAQGALAPLLWDWRRAPVLELAAGAGRLELITDPHGPLDLDALPSPLTVSGRRGGEQLRPRPGGPRRTVKALLQQARIAHAERWSLPLLASGGQLLAVADLWVDATVQAGAASVRRGRLIWRRGA